LYSRLSVNAQMWAKVDHVMKVGKNNFNPPPLVESNVVRIRPKVPRPAVSYDEWDGLLRICFVRKNRVLRSGFLGTTSVMEMIESNYRTYCAQHEIPLEDGPSDSVDAAMDEDMDMNADDDAIMDVDDDEDVPAFFKEEADKRAKKAEGNPNRKRKGKVYELVRMKVKKVLEDDTQLADKRARLCDEGDFLAMLYAFNQEGIHFN
jgi:18S rRNA (adenine1779-N6/adenine1780-N6)-dimethyltransferase